MTNAETHAEMMIQYNRYIEIRDAARAHSNVFSFNPAGYRLWQDMARAANSLRMDVLDASRAIEGSR